MALTLDRMALDDVGANPARIAAAIHQQLGEGTGAVPVYEIAKALDIIEIRAEPLTNFEGALITTPERGEGSILINKNSSPQRRRFTAGHELLHFLSPVHQPTSPDGFWCSRRDMIEHTLDVADRHRRQEAEANAFAIELLAPRSRIKRFLVSSPDLEYVVAMAAELDISKEAAARRYVECHPESLAVVFSKKEQVVYFDKAKDFPMLSLRNGFSVPEVPPAMGRPGRTSMEAIAADEWLMKPDGVELATQTLRQQHDRAITLLHLLSSEEDEDNGGIDDTLDRFNRFGG